MFEKLNPVDFLRNKYGGAKPTNRDIKLIENLISVIEDLCKLTDKEFNYEIKDLE